MGLGDSISSRPANMHQNAGHPMEPDFPGFPMSGPETKGFYVGVILLRNSARKRSMGVFSFARAAATK